MTAHADRDAWLDTRPITRAEAHAAALTVCDRLPADQARTVLEALGFTTYTGWHMLGRLGGGKRTRKQVVRRGWLAGVLDGGRP